MLEGLFYLALGVALPLFYMLPTTIAFRRGVVMPGGVMLVNLLFGWTMIAWIGCFIWAGTGATTASDAFFDRAGAA